MQQLLNHGPTLFLVKALQAMLDRPRTRFDVDCVLECDCKDEKIDSNTAIHLYYIIREAVFNAVRHGRPKTIDIQFSATGKSLQLIVEDNGAGFSEESVQRGIGLHTMKYRAKAIGATLTVVSAPGRGTMVKLQGEILGK